MAELRTVRRHPISGSRTRCRRADGAKLIIGEQTTEYLESVLDRHGFPQRGPGELISESGPVVLFGECPHLGRPLVPPRAREAPW